MRDRDSSIPEIAGATERRLHGKEYRVPDGADRYKADKLGMIRELPSGAREAVKTEIVARPPVPEAK